MRNRRRYLREAVESLLLEKISALEILVVDDASSDGSLDVVSDLPVRFLRSEKQIGQAAAQNLGIRNARGKYIGFLDSDDVLVEGGIRRRWEWLKSHPEFKVVAGSVAGIIDGLGRYLGGYQERVDPHSSWPLQSISKAWLQAGNRFPSYSWLLLSHRDLFSEVGGFDETLLSSHDNDFFHRILAVTEIPFLLSPVAFYRLHGDNVSGSWRKSGFKYSRRALAETLFVHLSHGVPIG